jgi:hypothetical protein
MTLEEFLNITDDEVWIRLTFADDASKPPLMVWGADWIGGYEGTLKEVEPYLEMVVDDMRIERHAHPELKRRYTPMICATLYKS